MLKVSTAKGSGDWASYGIIYPGRTCNNFNGEMLNVYLCNHETTGVEAGSVTEILEAYSRNRPTYRRFPGMENSGNLEI